MPTYSYRCPACGHEYDRFQKITDESLAECPVCNAAGEKVITGGVGLVFKGSGFYITDYKRAGEKKPGSGDAPKKTAGEKRKESSPPSPPSGDKKPGAKP
jgi:putative FmdB family regulatory protein